MTEHEKEVMRKLAMSLDACMELVESKANAERKSGDGQPFRQVTWQKRHEAFERLLNEADQLL